MQPVGTKLMNQNPNQLVHTGDDFGLTLSRFLALDSAQLPEAWQKLRRQIETRVNNQHNQTKESLNEVSDHRIKPSLARDKLHHSISQFLSESTQFMSSSESTIMQSHIYDDVFLTGSQDNIDAVQERPSIERAQNESSILKISNSINDFSLKSSTSTMESYKPIYIPGGRFPSIDMEQLFSDDDLEMNENVDLMEDDLEDQDNDNYDEAFIEGSDSDLKESPPYSSIDKSHPLRLLSSSALRKDTLVNPDFLRTKSRGKEYQFSQIDLPEVLCFKSSRTNEKELPNISKEPKRNPTAFRNSVRPYSDLTVNTYETLRFDLPENFAPDKVTQIYDSPVCSPNPSHIAEPSCGSQISENEGSNHVYSTIDKTLDPKPAGLLTTKTDSGKADSGIFCVSFAEASYSSNGSSTNGSYAENRKSCQNKTCTLDMTSSNVGTNHLNTRPMKSLVMNRSATIHNPEFNNSTLYHQPPEETNQNLILTGSKAFVPLVEEPNSSHFKRQFAGRFSLKIRRGSKDEEIGSISVVCPRDERGYFQIPFDKLDTPKKFNSVHQNPPRFDKSGVKKLSDPTSLKSRFSQLRSSIKRSLSLRK